MRGVSIAPSRISRLGIKHRGLIRIRRRLSPYTPAFGGHLMVLAVIISVDEPLWCSCFRCCVSVFIPAAGGWVWLGVVRLRYR
ncbi:hypothetical protein A5624_25805 [Mycobacterium sp. 1482292.6]|nr:hypothetical protein A5624_25805 [Mycobacterium sp. 1482292.6]OBJ21743.1 hypothetical protein A5622_16980 [Mycobacterium sp. 1245801.1]